MDDKQLAPKRGRRFAARLWHGLWATMISVTTLVMGYFTIYLYDQYRDLENPLVQLTQSTTSANDYLAGAVICLLLTIFAAYMAVQHWRASGQS